MLSNIAYNSDIKNLQLFIRAYTCLKEAGINTCGQLKNIKNLIC